ncbi:IAA-amino acid hydrolase ILR1-like 3 [Manihot esculenta]|nr:IAA-amino acid hydrolase ILR1-like 3 [Manihot esculenta]
MEKTLFPFVIPFTCLSYFILLSALASGSETKLSYVTRELLESAREPEFFNWLKRVRRRIHEYPELAFEEYNTSEVIRSELDSLGIKYIWPIAKTGGVGSVGSGLETWFGLRADMDALPIQIAFSDINSEGSVKLVFQPAEEGGGGAYHMLKEGALDKFQAIFGLHVEPELPVGSIASRPGTLAAGSARFLAVIKGKGGHAALPQDTRDPVLATSFAILALQQLISRETDPLEARVLSLGFIEAGQAGNVIPEKVRFGGTIRSITTEGLSYLQQRIKEVVENQAAVHQCSASVDFMEETMRPYPATVNDEAMYEHAKQVGEALLGESNVQVAAPIMAAEDFSFYAQKMKAAFFQIGVQNKNEKSFKRLHTPFFFLDEEVLPIGAALHAAVAISYLDNSAVETH